MRRSVLRDAVTGLQLLLVVLAAAQVSADNRPPDHPGRSLTAQASDPTAPLVQAQITYLYSDVVRDSSKDARQLLIEPVIPIPPTR